MPRNTQSNRIKETSLWGLKRGDYQNRQDGYIQSVGVSVTWSKLYRKL